jgi:hypothetical protein
MSRMYEIRASYDASTIVVWQAYPDRIADPAISQQKFVAPFSFNRMTWLKPSFAWMMHRSNWGQKSGQERVLAVRITRAGWEFALSQAVLTDPNPDVYPDHATWERAFKRARVHVQWDTERSLRGAALNRYSIQVGISRHLIHEYVDRWIVSIDDLTPTVRKMRELIRLGKHKQAQRLSPQEKVYPLPAEIDARLGAAR